MTYGSNNKTHDSLQRYATWQIFIYPEVTVRKSTWIGKLWSYTLINATFLQLAKTVRAINSSGKAQSLEQLLPMSASNTLRKANEWSPVKKLTATQLLMKFLDFMKPEGSLTCSWEPDESHPIFTPYLFKTHFQMHAQNCKKWLLVSSCPSVCLPACLPVCLNGTTCVLLDRISSSLIFEYFLKICQKIQISLKSDKNNCWELHSSLIPHSIQW
jgi:hypothetical protein